MSAALHTHCAREAIAAARQAGALLARYAGRPATVKTKRSAVDLVTEIDHASERLIAKRLERAFPAIGFLGEEHGHRRSDAPDQWVVDPLDGTLNFVHGVPLFGVSIGLVHRGRPVVGVVYDPSRRELFVAIHGRGATLNGRRIHVAPTRSFGHALLSTGFPVTFRTNPQPSLSWFQACQSRTHGVRRLGTTVLSLAYVAAGRLEGFYEENLWPWDIAAGIALVTEAGGRVSDFRGRPPALTAGRLVATNGPIHRPLLRVLAASVRRAAR